MHTIKMSLEMAKAIAMISRIDFTLAECATSTQANYIARKMDNFIKVRSDSEFVQKLAFYGMYEVANNKNEFVSLIKDFQEIGQSHEGTSVELVV
jgi:hypothetical protein